MDANEVNQQRLHDERQAIKAERDQLKADYHDACETIAQMHGAAVGGFGLGPKRGVVEDVQDLKDSHDDLLDFAEKVKYIVNNRAEPPSRRLEMLAELAPAVIAKVTEVQDATQSETQNESEQ